MLTLRSNHLFSMTFGVWLFAAAGTAQASIIDFTLTSPVAATAGDVITFNGTLTNTTSSPVFLNSLNLSLPGFDSSNLDPTPFFINTPASLGPSGSTGDVALFTVTIPDPFASGPYDGTAVLEGGSTSSSQTILGSADFTVQVGDASSAVPEPASIVLFSTGAVLMMVRARKSRVRRATPARVKIN